MQCPRCGSKVDVLSPGAAEQVAPSAAAELVDEIRTVTVLFADVAGSTEMAARLGLESVKLLMDRIFDRIYHIVLDHGGQVDKFIGDCVMALFGAPLAYGDDPARAVRAGLAIIRALQEMEPELLARDLPIVRMRVGINTGPVIAGAVGAGPERRFTVLGHAVNVAAHLQQEAPIGTVLVGQGTHRRIRGLFRFKEHMASSGRAYRVEEERTDGVWLRPREVLGRVARGEALAREAVELAREREMDGTAAAAMMVVARSLAARARLPEAVEASGAAVALLDRVGSVEGFEQEILQVHAELSALVGDDESAKGCRARAREDIDRKAQFIESEPVRRRFLAHVGRIAAKLAAALVVDLALPPAAEERDGA